MKYSFIAFMGFRYFRSKRRGVGVTSTVLSILGVAVGVMALTAVMGVMNGFQLGFIDSILEISSYHIQIKEIRGDGTGPALEDVLGRLRAQPDVRSLVPFSEHQVIIEGRLAEPRGALIRGLPPDVGKLDPAFMQSVEIVAGDFGIDRPGALVLGVELSRHLGVSVGDSVSILSLEGPSFSGLRPSRRVYQVAGLFRSGYYEFDLGWAFFSLEEGSALNSGTPAPLTIGVKIGNRFRDQQAVRQIQNVLGSEKYRIVSWREFNRAFFGALRMEKIMMTVLIGLIFVVVGFNIHHSLQRAVRERFEEIGLFKALGASEAAVRRIFILDGLLIGTIGALVGLLLGLLISVNINTVFRLAEMFVNAGLALVDMLLFPLVRSTGSRFSLFSPAYFYITEVPSTVLLREAVLIVLFAVFSPTAAAVSATRRVKDVKPAEVLRYE